MKVNYQYASPSMCMQQGDQTVLGLSPDLSREEKVSFSGRLKHPLIFRDAMLMLREIVVSDAREKKKERVEFFAWLEQEIERRMLVHEQYLPGVRENLQQDMQKLIEEQSQKDKEMQELAKLKSQLKKQIDARDVWKDYYKIEKDFWKFIKERDLNLWYVLDPVITVHPDQVSFEAFSSDESVYGCLSVRLEEFDLIQQPQLGTTNIDFSAKLAREMERFRTYTNVELSVNPGGFAVDTGVMPEHIEKKIELPETWIKGFNQVSAAASLKGTELELFPVDMYDICSFLRRHKAHKSPRYMKWLLEPNKPVKIIFEPFKTEMTLKAVYKGEKKREEKIWGRERWLVLEKLIPVTKTFKVRLQGFGMPQFITADMEMMQMTVGFSSWSANDWVKGTAFNVMAGFCGEGSYDAVYQLLKKHRVLTMESIYEKLKETPKSTNKSGIGMLLRRGEGYYDATVDAVRFRQLCNIPIPEDLYRPTAVELETLQYLEEGMEHFSLKMTQNKELVATQSYNMPNSKYQNWRYSRTADYHRKYDLTETKVVINEDGQIAEVKCKCKTFNKGPRNISAPCAHILALYLTASKFSKLELIPDKEYKMNDIMEVLL